MKVTTSSNSIFKKSTTKDYNFDRIVRVSLYKGESKYKTKEPALVFEYCPHDDTRQLYARIDASINYRPQFNSGDSGSRKKPGFSAVVKLYNVDASVMAFINDTVVNMLNYGNNNKDGGAVAYYAAKGYVSIEAGYWNHEQRQRDYTELFAGYLNSSAYYRSGVDTVLELYCHNISMSSNELTSVKSSIKKSQITEGKRKTVSKETAEAVSNIELAEGNFDTLVKKIMKQYTEPLTIFKIPQRINIHYITQPKNSRDPSENMTTDSGLESFATGGSSFKIGLDTKAEKIESVRTDYLTRLCNYNSKSIRFKTIKNTASYDVYFWIATAEKTQGNTVSKGAVIEITDFQNFIEAPTIDGTGAFTLRMMLHPEINPGNYVVLKWTGSIAGNAIASYAKGVALSSSQANYYTQLQAGEYQANVAGLTGTAGSVFNVKFMVAFMTHKISTHSNTWETSLKTTCAEVRGS